MKWTVSAVTNATGTTHSLQFQSYLQTLRPTKETLLENENTLYSYQHEPSKYIIDSNEVENLHGFAKMSSILSQIQVYAAGPWENLLLLIALAARYKEIRIVMFDLSSSSAMRRETRP